MFTLSGGSKMVTDLGAYGQIGSNNHQMNPAA